MNNTKNDESYNDKNKSTESEKVNTSSDDLDDIFIFSEDEKPVAASDSESYADTDEYELRMIELAKARRSQLSAHKSPVSTNISDKSTGRIISSGASANRENTARTIKTQTASPALRANLQHSANAPKSKTTQNSGAASASAHSQSTAVRKSTEMSAPVSRSRQDGLQNPVGAKSALNAAGNPRTSKKPSGHTKKSKKSKGFNGSALSSVLKAVIYIVFVLIISSALGFFGVSVGNDVFALVKSEAEVQVTIPENTTLESLAAELKNQGVIKYPFFFKLYANLRHDNEGFVAGTYTVSPSMNYDILRNSFQQQAKEITTLSITIPEGYTVDQIINLMVENGLGTQEKYIDVIQNYEFDYWFINELTPNDNRKYRLEGYLYPDTYYFFSNATEVQVLYKLLDRFDEIFPDAYREECAASGWTVDQLITLSSIIQMEAKYESEYGYISSVLHNRLNYPYYETQGYLQSDATTQYALGLDRTTDLYGVDNEIDSPYNTYKYKGLPPGPITNPSFSAMTWALYPSDTDYFYFVAKPDGYSLFATNSTDHAHNIIEARGIG